MIVFCFEWLCYVDVHIIFRHYNALVYFCESCVESGSFVKFLIETNEPPSGKTNNVVSEQVRHKPGCTITEDS